MIAISLACFGLLWLLLRRFGERVGFVLASIAWALWLVAATEILSIFDALRFAPVAGAWLVALVGLGAAAWLVEPTNHYLQIGDAHYDGHRDSVPSSRLSLVDRDVNEGEVEGVQQ